MKKTSNISIFLIVKALGINKLPHHIFISDDYEMAKLNFDHYVQNYTYPSDFILYKIGEIGKNLNEIKTCKIYIKTGKQEKMVTKSEQLELKKMYIDASKEEKTKEIVKKLFNGKELKL